MKKTVVAALFALGGVVSAQADTPPAPSKSTACTWESVARKYNVNPYILYSIAKTESNLNPDATNRANNNGSEDVGMMQINSFWFKRLETRYGITRQDLFNPCISLEVGAYVLSMEIARHGNSWEAIGAYNAVTPWKRKRYANLIFDNLPADVRGARP